MSADRIWPLLRGTGLQLAIILLTLIAAELILRTVDLRYLRDNPPSPYKAVYNHDRELGWVPIPNLQSKFEGSHIINVRHNSLGLRDIEHDHAPKPTILFIGDSFTWGYDVEASDRFTDLLRQELPGIRIVNAGVSGYGTDQEYLFLKRLWNVFKPNVVVLTYCTANDREDNSSNSRYDGYYKPYLKQLLDGTWQFRGQPVPKSRHVYFINDWIVRNLWLARVAVSAYVTLRHSQIWVPDPTERLVGMMHKFVEARGAKFMVGLQHRDAKLQKFLESQKISYTSFDGAEIGPKDSSHWSPKGHAFVANGFMSLLSQAGIIDARSDK